MLASIAAGGALGAMARYGIAVAIPHSGTGFPWATFAANASGCLAIGALMVALTEAHRLHRLLRPFLGVGLLGGYTTFSTYVVDTLELGMAGGHRVALLYAACTLAAALLAVLAGMAAMRLVWHGVTRNRRRDRVSRDAPEAP